MGSGLGVHCCGPTILQVVEFFVVLQIQCVNVNMCIICVVGYTLIGVGLEDKL